MGVTRKTKKTKGLKRSEPGTYYLVRKHTNGHTEYMNMGTELPVFVTPEHLVKVTPEYGRPPTPWPTADVKTIVRNVRKKYRRDEDGVPVMGKPKKK